jgi:hypothetical protein
LRQKHQEREKGKHGELIGIVIQRCTRRRLATPRPCQV